MTMQKAESAVSFIPPHDRDVWIKIGMALKNEFGEDGFEPWSQWSQGAESYNERSAKAVWRSISAAGKIGIGTLFREAAGHGWRDSGEQRGPLTADEIAAKHRASLARDQATIAEDARKHRGYQKAAIESQKVIDSCRLETHYYLNSKGLPDAIGLVLGHDLIVPMRNPVTNQLMGIQTISWIPEDRRWEKKMAFGMRSKGSVLRLGPPKAAETFLCEGYATGLTLEMALRRLRLSASVLICFSDSNLAHVATGIEGRAFVSADNDIKGVGERAAKQTEFPYFMSPVVGNDANDDHAKFGLMAVCKQIMDVRR
ncbi:PriCT-2 domain-containing protein [Glaciimonas immobilis]|uniref:Putative DNA primase/helicase n=1 Tax=Glaciimonas immobilis TaxID=728004 RepID=A0A840RUQ5_9BURK|nr:PriCT-2 domain-containing protein [Glaciimonas immobilis]KAF3997520.1 hypothetical protein HAV38_12640 [Glaciimonas immobilis]MBB5200798.1 putative DNA primase/helicase [Glaciimonas immobilis]